MTKGRGGAAGPGYR